MIASNANKPLNISKNMQIVINKIATYPRITSDGFLNIYLNGYIDQRNSEKCPSYVYGYD